VVESVTGEMAWVRLDGELWEVSCDDSLAPDDTVTVQAIEELILQVTKDKGGNT
jgi:membrane-bound serine protease (ClpP class)